jgi:anti-sigma factor RsiW
MTATRDELEHPEELLALYAAGVLDAAEEAALMAHLRACTACTQRVAEWRNLAQSLRAEQAPRLSPGLVARTLRAVASVAAERGERTWNRAALGFLVAFAWTLTLSAWLLFEVVGGALKPFVERPLASAGLWFAGYLIIGWLAAGAAAALLGRRAQEEGRTV